MLTYVLMETTITAQTDTEAKLSVTLDADYLAKLKTEVFNDLRKRVKASGFRPGHAPDMIVERELGSSTVQSEFIEHAIQHSYSDAIRAQNFSPIASPQVSLEKFVPYTELQYKATIELLPKVKLADYTKFRVKRPQALADPAEVERTIEDLRRRLAARLQSEHPAKAGDEVNFDFAGKKDGQDVPGASAKNQTLQLGSGQFIPGFEDELTGLRQGDEKTFEIRFPKGYQEASLADQLVTFEVKVNNVTELVLPEVDDKFAADAGPFESVSELKADITDKIAGEKAEEVSRKYEQDVLDKLLKDSSYKTPEALVTQQLSRMRSELDQNLAASGLTFDKYLELSKKSSDEMDKEMRPEAERRVGLAMILTEVANQENLTVDPADLDREIERLKAAYPDPQTQKELENPSTREEVYNHLMASKVIAKLITYAEGS